MFFGANWFRPFNANLNLNFSERIARTRSGPASTTTAIRFSTIVRPGAGRNSLRGAAAGHAQRFFVYNIPIGQKKLGPMPPGIFNHGQPREFQRADDVGRCAPAFRVGIVVNAQNITNRANYVGYSGTLSSPLFGQPTAVQGMRRVDVGLNFNF
jgi:hypothetical protein